MRKLTITGTGPLTRSTVGAGRGDIRFEVTNDVLHWIWSWRLQVKRHEESTNCDGNGGTDVERRRSFSATSYDEHILAVVGGHLVRAVSRAEESLPGVQLDPALADALRLLRNVYEHWGEHRPVFQDPSKPKQRSGKKFLERFPEGHPWSVTFTSEDWMLGGVVPIHQLTRDLDALEKRLLALEAQYRNESAEE